MTKIMDYVKKDILRFVLVVSLVLNFGVGAADLLGKDAVPDYVVQMVNKIEIIYGYSCDEMIRFVEKQYTKVTEKPDDFYQSDLEYLIDNVWPNIPDEKKTKSLITKYEYLVQFYETQLAGKKSTDILVGLKLIG